MKTGRPITNRSCYFTEHHWRLLWLLALKLRAVYPQFEPEDLVNEAWLAEARYYGSVVNKAIFIKLTMLSYISRTLAKTTKEIPTPAWIMDSRKQPHRSDYVSRDEIGFLLKELDNREMQICLKLATGWKPKELGAEMNLHRESIRLINNKAKQKILQRSKL